MRRALAIITMLVFALATACSSNELADQGDRDRTGATNDTQGDGKSKKARGKKKSGGAGNVANEIDAAADAGSAGGAAAPDDFGGGDAPSSGIDPSLARAAAAEEDPPDDAKTQGLTPDYTELTRTAIQGLGNNVRITMRFAGNVPDRVEKNHYMVVAIGITGQKKDDGVALGATCNEEGWHPYAGGKDQRQEFPGTFEVQGTEIVMELPWSFLRGPRAFEWYASAGWYRQIANQTHWAFDSIPNNRAAKFPGN